MPRADAWELELHSHKLDRAFGVTIRYGFSRAGRAKIISSCGKHVHIVIAGIVDCKFREPGYGGGTFTLTNDTKGIVVISPSSGTKSTTFTILGALLGSGHFVVKDAKGRELRVTVKVTL